MLLRQIMLTDGCGQRLHNLMPADRTAPVRVGNGLAPPFKPNPAEGRFADPLADPCNLVIEGVEREQRLATRGRGKQSRLKPVAVVAPHKRRDRRQAVRPGGTSVSGRRSYTDRFHITWDGRHGSPIAAATLPA